MYKKIDPKKFGLNSRLEIFQLNKNLYEIIKTRKSRIVMVDGEKFLEQVKKILEVDPGAIVRIKTTAPVCSKTRKFLHDHQIEICE